MLSYFKFLGKYVLLHKVRKWSFADLKIPLNLLYQLQIVSSNILKLPIASMEDSNIKLGTTVGVKISNLIKLSYSKCGRLKSTVRNNCRIKFLNLLKLPIASMQDSNLQLGTTLWIKLTSKAILGAFWATHKKGPVPPPASHRWLSGGRFGPDTPTSLRCWQWWHTGGTYRAREKKLYWQVEINEINTRAIKKNKSIEFWITNRLNVFLNIWFDY